MRTASLSCLSLASLLVAAALLAEGRGASVGEDAAAQTPRGDDPREEAPSLLEPAPEGRSAPRRPLATGERVVSGRLVDPFGKPSPGGAS